MKQSQSTIRSNQLIANLGLNDHLQFATKHSLSRDTFAPQLDSIVASASGDANAKATFTAALFANLCTQDMLSDGLWRTLPTDELEDWYELCRDDYFERHGSLLDRLNELGIDSHSIWKQSTRATLAPFFTLTQNEELGVFLIHCPLNDDSGYDAWWEAIDETLHGFLELALCGDEERSCALSTWKDKLSSGKLWDQFVNECLEFELEDWDGNDLAPIKGLFTEVGNQLLVSEMET